MSRRRPPSPQTIKVLLAMADQPAAWRYGYDLGREVGLKSGSLYPILIRLADRALVDATWEENAPLGRPARHLYRLTTEGLALAASVRPAWAQRPARLDLRTAT
jgi:PadR family transcriptional regulator